MISSNIKNKINKIINQESTNETIYTIFLLDYKIDECINFLYDKLKKIKQLSNLKKKKDANNRIFNFIQKLEKIKNEKNITIISGLFILSDIIQGFSFNNDKKLINDLKKYNIKKFIFINENYVDFELINNIFDNETLCNVIKINNNKCIHYKFNNIRKKNIFEFDLTTIIELEKYIKNNIYIKNKKKTFVIFPKYPKKDFSENLNNLIHIYEKDINDTKIFELNILLNNKENLQKLDDFMINFNNPKNKNLLLFGKLEEHIKDAIELYMVKKLFIHNSIKNNFYNIINKDFINFEIIWIDRYTKNDLSDTFLKDWNGVIGELYYEIKL